MSFDEAYNEQKIINVEINREVRKSFLDYSMSVITSRALPDVRDGLKPVHRRILYTMYENGLYPDKPYRKCADTVGSVLGRYHPHGDASVYDAMVRLAQDFSMRYTLVDGHGNFGSVDGDPPAAYRYTESKLKKLSLEMLTDIDKDTVDFIPNYDDRLKEPTVLPSRYPNLLVNGSVGIAVGMATNIPPHNLREVVAAMNCLIDNPDATLEELMTHLPGPDFPTRGIIMGRAGIRAAYGTGRGKIIVRARAEIVETKGDRHKIVVTEIPYGVNKAKLIESMADLVKDKRIEGISDIHDYSSRSGMHIDITLKRDANPQVVLNQLYTYTQLQSTFGVIMLALVNGEPKILTLKQILQQYIDYQCEIVTRRTRYDLKKAQERAHILEGLLTALDFIDEVIAILRASKSIPEGREALMNRFGLDEVQAQAIVQMRLGQLTGLERIKVEDEMAQLKAKIADFIDILSNESSANESNIGGESVNHQYSKSFEFERDFDEFRRRNFPKSAVYFSLLRPFCELQIAKQFALYKQYHAIFRSCNRGGKKNIWCCECPKCLFVAIMLSPFLPPDELNSIFGCDMLAKTELETDFDGLCGFTGLKPFECVGTADEVVLALTLTAEKYRKSGLEMPALLRRFCEKNTARADYSLLSGFNEENLIPKKFDECVKRMFEYVSAAD